MENNSRLIGLSEIRKDANCKADGSAQYVADLRLPGMTYAVAVRSPHHHAKIKSIDTSLAKQFPGVLAVLTSVDVPGEKTFGALIPDQPVLAVDEVRHMGEPVALVVAKDLDTAKKAAARVSTDYQILPPVFDPVSALEADSPGVHPGGNLLSRFNLDAGDPAAGFETADIILEEDFSVPRISPGYMETENSVARYNPDGTLTVWVSSQEPFVDRSAIASVLALDEEKVQVLTTIIGGAFGGKEDSSLQVMTAFAAYMTRGTVKMVNNRSESFLAHPKRHPAKIHLKLGVKQDGTLTALQGTVWMDTGAYATYGPAVGSLLTEMVTGPYRIPNVAVETNVVFTTSPSSGAMRGFGSPQAHFAIESAMDMLAERLGLDAADLREKNILHPGDALPSRVIVNETGLGLERCLQEARKVCDRLKLKPASPGKVSGVGFALGMQSMGLGAKVPDFSRNRLEWLPDGRVLIHLGAPELGQGLVTVVEQITASALGLPFSQVVASQLDTTVVPNGGVTCASRMTYLAGNAMLNGAEVLKKRLLSEASKAVHVSPEDLVYENGNVVLPDGSKLPASEFASRAAEDGLPIQADAVAEFLYAEDKTPDHLPIGMPHIKYSFAAQVVRVEVDPELGTVEVTDLTAIHDLGRVINRMAAEGQIEGGVMMGLGYALYEDMFLKPNGHWVDSFTEYLMPTICELPGNFEVTMLEYPELDGPYGAKGIAEITVVPTAPAIANAVNNAVHARVQSLPLTPEKICAGMKWQPA
jgi:CO/xanthine dehydrogenase Mo-binding subunit